MPSLDEYNEYHQLVAETYDLFHAKVNEREITFYRTFIEQAGGPALDVGTGTGRVMLPLLRAGLDVDGLDASADMLAVNRQRAAREGFSPRLYHQFMQDMEVERQYSTLFLPYSSFTLIQDPADAREALRRFHAALRPGGQVLLEAYLRTDFDSFTDGGQWVLTRFGTRPSDGARIYVSRAGWMDHVASTERVFWRYEVFQDNRMIECRNQEINLRMYTPPELTAMLEAAGFTVERLYGDHLFEEVGEGAKLMIARAVKG